MTNKAIAGERLDLLKRIIIRCKKNDAGGNDNGYPVNTWDELLELVDGFQDYEDQKEELNISAFRLDQMRNQRDELFIAFNAFFTAICQLPSKDKNPIDVIHFTNAKDALRKAIQ